LQEQCFDIFEMIQYLNLLAKMKTYFKREKKPNIVEMPMFVFTMQVAVGSDPTLVMLSRE